MKTTEIIGVLFTLLFAVSFLVYSYKIMNWNYNLKLLRLYPNRFYNQTVIYTDNEQFKHRVKLLFHFSYDTISIEFMNSDTKNVNIMDLEPCKF